MAETFLDDYVQCRRCEFVGPEGCVFDHYVREELDCLNTPFQCKLCPARFYRKQQARAHKNRDHYQPASTFRQMFWGSLKDLTVDDMVRRPAFLRGNRPGRSSQDRPRRPKRTRNQARPEPRVPVQLRLGPRPASPRCPAETVGASTSNSEPIYGNDVQTDAVASGLHASSAVTPSAGQAIATAECAPVTERDAQARQSDSESSRGDISSSDSDDSDTGNLSDRTDRTTAYKRRPRQEMRYSPQPADARADTVQGREQPVDEHSQPGVAHKGDSMLRDAIQQLTQELKLMRQEFQTVTETQQTVIQELRETNRQLREVNEYHQFVLEIKHRKHQASAGLVEQCRAASQRRRNQQQARSNNQ